jgi:hypothetical protein
MIETFKEDEPDFKQFKRDIVKASIVIIGFAIIICAFFLSLKMGFDSNPLERSARDRYSMVPKFTFVDPKPTRTIGLHYLKVFVNLEFRKVLEPEIVLRQTALETGWYTSKNCVDRNNIFGMTGGKKTKTNPEGYKIYTSWRKGVIAYKEWQDRNYNPNYCGTYYDFLEHIGYATSPTYTDKLKQIKFR